MGKSDEKANIQAPHFTVTSKLSKLSGVNNKS